ncbi:MAG TPA: glycosyltransferase family 2 protein, partial [Umezawaea sp.]|nr:glycosyltransferase family 2 protein [Umezawaea sp.]
MIGVLLLALLVLGINLTLYGVIALARGRRGATTPVSGTFVPDPGSVAVLIAAHDGADLVADAIRAAARLVPPENVHVVSDDSTDRTADVARECGVQVAETMGRLGRAAAFDGAIQAFRLVDRFEFVVLLDVDAVLDPYYLDAALPLFEDPDVVAVDGRLDLDLRPPPKGFAGRLLSAYRARSHALAEGLRQARRTGTPMNVGRVVPSVGRIYRASALWDVDIHSSGLAVDDFDTTLRIYREQFGTVAFCPTARAAPAQPTRLREHREQLSLWGNGFWRAVRGHGLRGDLPQAAQTVELVLASLALVLAPVAIVAAAVPGLLPVSPWALVAAVVVPDYLLTLTVALGRRTPSYLLPGLLFPVLRVLDAGTLLRSRWGHPAANEWPRFGVEAAKPVERSEPAATRRIRPAAVLAWFILVGSAAVIAARVALTAGTLPATRIEPGLVDATFAKVSGLGAPPVEGALRILGLQLDAYATVTGAFSRQATTLVSARELSVVSVFVMLIGLVAVAALLRVRPLVMAVAVLTLAVSGPVITVLTPVGPGVTAAAWTALAAAAALGAVKRRDALWVAGLIALLLALATASVLVVPIGIGGAVWFALADHRPSTRVWTSTLTLATAAGVALLCLRGGLLATPDTESFLRGDQRALLLAVVAAAVLAGLLVAWLRPVAAAAATGAVLVALAAPGADAVLPALVLTTATLVALVVDETIGRFPAATPARVRWVATSLASAAAIIGSAVGVVLAPESGRAVDHNGL